MSATFKLNASAPEYIPKNPNAAALKNPDYSEMTPEEREDHENMNSFEFMQAEFDGIEDLEEAEACLAAMLAMAPAQTRVPMAPAQTRVPMAPAQTRVPMAPAQTRVPMAPAQTRVPIVQMIKVVVSTTMGNMRGLARSDNSSIYIQKIDTPNLFTLQLRNGTVEYYDCINNEFSYIDSVNRCRHIINNNTGERYIKQLN